MGVKRLTAGNSESAFGGAGASASVTVTVQPPAGIKMAQATVNVTTRNGGNSSARLEFPGQPRRYTDVTSISNVGPAEIVLTW